MSKPGKPSEESIVYAAEAARDAFWECVATEFDEVKSGDFPPLSQHAFATATEQAIRTWLEWNHPAYALEDTRQINMERIAALVRPELPGVPVEVAMTGGNVATIVVGEREGDYNRAIVQAGPGWFTGPGWTEGRASLDEFSASWDDTVTSCGFRDVVYGPETERAGAELAIAADLVRLYLAHPCAVKGE